MQAHTSGAWALLSPLALAGSLQLAACGGGDPAAAAHLMPMTPTATPAATAAATPQRPALRHATPERVAIEELVAAPYTLVIDADDEAAVASGLRLADTVHTFAGGKSQMGVFVRSREPALAERLAVRLMLEQGWEHVFVVR
jgi:hypothetical protein